MSTHYSSNQFESAFVPCRLQNYELPSDYKKYPSQRKGCTKTITNDRGHIMLQANKKESANPWGNFIGTWQKPRKPIKLRVTTKFMARGFHGDSTMGSAGIGTSNNCLDTEVKKREESVSKEAQSSASPYSESRQSSGDAHKSPEAANRSSSNTQVAVNTTSLSTPSSRCASAQTSRSTSITEGKSSKQRISSAGNTPYSRISPCDEPRDSSRPGSSFSSVTSTPSRPVSSIISAKKPLSSGSSRVSTAPTNASRVSRQSDCSMLGSSQSQRTCQSFDRPDSRQGNGQQSVMVGSSHSQRMSSSCSSYMESHPSSQASVAFTSSTTKSGCKHRGVQCSHT